MGAGVAQHAHAGGELEQRRDREARAQQVVAAEAVGDHRRPLARAFIARDYRRRFGAGANRFAVGDWGTNLPQWPRRATARPPRASSPRCARSGAAAPFVASLIGRLPMGAVGLVFILRTNEITGSFALGGLATGAYALSIGVLAPAMGRLIDLKGQTRVLLGCGLVYASALACFAALPDDAARSADRRARRAHRRRRSRRSGRRCARCGTRRSTTPRRATCCSPASPPCSRRSTSAGPVLIVAGIGGLISISAAALACGLFGLLGTRHVRRHRAPRARGGRRPTASRGLAGALASPGVRTLLATMTVVGAGVGIIEVAVPALCERNGTPERDRLRARPLGPRQPHRRRRGGPPGGRRGPRAARDRAAGGARGGHRPARARLRRASRSAR